MIQNQVTTKAPVAVPAPVDTTGLTEAEVFTYKTNHQTESGNGLTLYERV
jgi:hypothetical protein